MDGSITWQLAERVTKDSIVDMYLENFANDPNYDNAVMLVQYVMNLERNRKYGDGHSTINRQRGDGEPE